MRNLTILALCLIITSCHQIKNTRLTLLNPPLDLSIFNVPDVPEDVPELDKYVIRTRIVIEGAIARIIGGEKEKQLWAIQPEKAMEHLELAEEIYADLNIKFHVVSITFRSYATSHREHLIDSAINFDVMSIHYMLPNDFPYQGISSGPWEIMDTGILLAFGCDEYTLAHEIGHFFGLLHPFEVFGDMVGDTPSQAHVLCNEEENKTENCKNALSYCKHSPKYVTPGQICRMEQFLRATRMNYVIPASVGESLFKRGLPKIASLDLTKG